MTQVPLECSRLSSGWLKGVTVLLATLGMSDVAAQSAVASTDDEPDAVAEPIEEITVVGHRFLRELRLEVQASQERVYDLFNELNTNEEFDIHCHDGARRGTKIVRRVCRPATSEAAKWYLVFLKWDSPGGFSKAQGEIAIVHLKERQMAAEVRRLIRESREFRRAIAEHQALEGRYEAARRGVAIQTLVSIVDTVGAGLSGGSAWRISITAPESV